MNYLKTIFQVIFLSFLNTNVIACNSSDNEKIAQQVLESFQTDDPERILGYFDEPMKLHLGAWQLGNLWKGIIIQHGPFKEMTKMWTEEYQGHEVVILRCVFQNSSLQLRFNFDEKNRISGMFFQSDE